MHSATQPNSSIGRGAAANQAITGDKSGKAAANDLPATGNFFRLAYAALFHHIDINEENKLARSSLMKAQLGGRMRRQRPAGPDNL